MSLIAHLESKLLPHFDNLSTEFFNLEDVIIKNLQIVSYLSNRIVSLESNHNMLEQYGRRNNIEITGIPDTVEDNELENKVIEISYAIGVEAKPAGFENCHRVGKSKNNSKKVIARFVNRNVVKNALDERKQLKTNDKTSIELQNAMIFLNENLTLENNKIAYHCRKLKPDGTISKTYTSNETNIICCKPQKVYHVNDLCVIFSQILTLVTMIMIILITQLTNHYSSAINGQNNSFCYRNTKVVFYIVIFFVRNSAKVMSLQYSK